VGGRSHRLCSPRRSRCAVTPSIGGLFLVLSSWGLRSTIHCASVCPSQPVFFPFPPLSFIGSPETSRVTCRLALPDVCTNLVIEIRKILHPDRTSRPFPNTSRWSLPTRLPLNCPRNRGCLTRKWERESEYRQDCWRGKRKRDRSYRRCEVGG